MGHIKRVVEYISQEDFIPLVEEQPAIWNIHCEEYTNRNRRKQAWESIYVQFLEDYHDRSPEEQTEIAICFQTKWKSLRNSFSRELKKRKRGINDGRKPYVYFDQLRFLENAQKHIYYAGDGATSNEGDNSGASTPPPTTPNRAKRIRLQNNDKSPPAAQDDQDVVQDDSGDDSNDSTANHDDPAVVDKDGDKLFMLSLVPEFKRIPENRRLLAKSEILNVILKAQGFV